jgi:hypothetical protein
MSKTLKSLSWMAKTQAKVLFTAVATGLAYSLIHKTVSKYPRLKIIDTKK